jgi:hypothetical protein
MDAAEFIGYLRSIVGPPDGAWQVTAGADEEHAFIVVAIDQAICDLDLEDLKQAHQRITTMLANLTGEEPE